MRKYEKDIIVIDAYTLKLDLNNKYSYINIKQKLYNLLHRKNQHKY